MKTLRDRLLFFFKRNPDAWFRKGSIITRRWKNSEGGYYMPDTVGRELRRMENDKLVAARYKEGEKGVSYRLLKEEERENYVLTKNREGGKKSRMFKDKLF